MCTENPIGLVSKVVASERATSWALSDYAAINTTFQIRFLPLVTPYKVPIPQSCHPPQTVSAKSHLHQAPPPLRDCPAQTSK